MPQPGEHDWRRKHEEQKRGRPTGRVVFQCEQCRQWKEDYFWPAADVGSLLKPSSKECSGEPTRH